MELLYIHLSRRSAIFSLLNCEFVTHLLQGQKLISCIWVENPVYSQA